MNTIILVTGVARAGKDTFSAFLMNSLIAEGQKAELFKFADVLKDRANDMLKAIGLYKRDVIDFNNEDFKCKNRDMLVTLAVTLRRIDKDIFARHLNAGVSLYFELADLNSNNFAIVSDWRYLNEYELLKKYQTARFVTIEICRPGFMPANQEETNSIKELFATNIIQHRRIAVDPSTLKTMASEIAQLYLK